MLRVAAITLVPTQHGSIGDDNETGNLPPIPISPTTLSLQSRYMQQQTLTLPEEMVPMAKAFNMPLLYLFDLSYLPSTVR